MTVVTYISVEYHKWLIKDQPEESPTQPLLFLKKRPGRFMGHLRYAKQKKWLVPDEHPWLPQTYKMEHYALTANGFWCLTFVTKLSIFDVCGSPT